MESKYLPHKQNLRKYILRNLKALKRNNYPLNNKIHVKIMLVKQ